ncbi:MAG: imidazole glycerol phosphate synthase subunit HisH [Actinomycetota bacterium]
MPRIAVLDFGMGNLRSVAKALERAGATVDVTPDVADDADGLVVPGQGHFGSCIVNLSDRAKDVVRWIERGRPYLGICLGLQILLEGSEEAQHSGLGVLPGRVRRLPGGLKVPHIGWNEVMPSGNAPMLAGIAPGTRFYFVHSYYPDPADGAAVAATTGYGIEFCCAVARDNVWATQFHPEKSGDPGIALLRTFVGRCA